MHTSLTSNETIVVLGSGQAAWTLVKELRKQGYDQTVRLITDTCGDFYSKPSLSNALAQGKRPEQLVVGTADKLATDLKIDLLAHTTATSIDLQQRLVHTSGQGLTGAVPYDKLILATGASQIRVPVAGSGAAEIVSVNSLEDYSRLRHLVRTGEHLLILGAGLIGVEFANDFIANGIKVTLVDPAPRALAALLPEALSLQLQQALSGLGVSWHFGVTLAAIDARNEPAKKLRCTLSDNSSVLADHVLSAVGLRPNLDLALAAGLKTDRGILVDATLATSDPNVFALGDLAQYASADNRVLPFILPIMHAARVLAGNLSNQVGTQAGKLPARLQFPVMPIAIKTPALPLTVLPPSPGQSGEWSSPESGVWEWHDSQHRLKGFALAGPACAQRQAMLARVVPADRVL